MFLPSKKWLVWWLLPPHRRVCADNSPEILIPNQVPDGCSGIFYATEGAVVKSGKVYSKCIEKYIQFFQQRPTIGILFTLLHFLFKENIKFRDKKGFGPKKGEKAVAPCQWDRWGGVGTSGGVSGHRSPAGGGFIYTSFVGGLKEVCSVSGIDRGAVVGLFGW